MGCSRGNFTFTFTPDSFGHPNLLQYDIVSLGEPFLTFRMNAVTSRLKENQSRKKIKAQVDWYRGYGATTPCAPRP
jgi:hypothetical protein